MLIINKGCIGFFAILVGVEKQSKYMQYQILQIFFPENILGLPSSCDINFTIKLTLGVTQISSSEMSELKKQFMELYISEMSS